MMNNFQNASNSDYITLFDSLTDLIHLVDKDLRIIMANKILLDKNRDLGLSTDIIGKSLFEAFPFLNDNVRKEYEQVFRTGDTVLTEEIISISGINYNSETRKIPVVENGEVVRVVTMNRDITDKKRIEKTLRESEGKFQSIFVSMSEGAALCKLIEDEEGNPVNYVVLEINPAIEQMFSINRKDIIGKTITEITNLDKPFYLGIFALVAKQGSPTSFEAFVKPFNKNFQVSVHSPEKGLFALVLQDITFSLKSRLELEKAKESAEEGNKFKTAILSNLNHEIRTPMNGILGFAQLLMYDLEDPELLDTTEMIIQSGKRLLNTLNSILTLSELETNKQNIHLDNIHMPSLIKQTLVSFETLFEKKGIYCNIEIKNNKIFALIDEYLMYQALYNIIDNSLKFTNEGGVTVVVDTIMEADKLFSIVKITDTGVGIQADVVKYMYDAFRQGSEGLDRKYEGIGLGLTLTKKMIDLMDGRMTVESIVDQGSTFTLIFKGTELDYGE